MDVYLTGEPVAPLPRRAESWNTFVRGPEHAERLRVLAMTGDAVCADDGCSDEEMAQALQRIRYTGRRVVLLSSHPLAELRGDDGGEPLLRRPDLYDIVVAELGGLLWHPATGAVEWIGAPASVRLCNRLRAEGIHVSPGLAMIEIPVTAAGVATRFIDSLGLDLEVVRSGDTCAVVSRGVSYARGLDEALLRLDLPAGMAIGIGFEKSDAEELRDCTVRVCAGADDDDTLVRYDRVTAREGAGALVEVIESLLHADAGERRALAPPLIDIGATD